MRASLLQSDQSIVLQFKFKSSNEVSSAEFLLLSAPNMLRFAKCELNDLGDWLYRKFIGSLYIDSFLKRENNL